MFQNQFPWWKNTLVVLIILLGFLFSVPNLFGDDPAIQMSPVKGDHLPPEISEQIHTSLSQEHLEHELVLDPEKSTLLIKFKNASDQLKAQDTLKARFGEHWTIALNLAPATPHWLSVLGAQPMKLGLDLRGGVHFLLEVDVEATLNRRLISMIEDLKVKMRSLQIRYQTVVLESDARHLTIRLQDASNLEKAFAELAADQPDLRFEINPKHSFEIQAQLKEPLIKEIRDYAVDQTITTLRKRVNELEVSEALVQRQGLNRIVVELPGIQDTARAKEIIGKTASVEFHLLDTDAESETHSILSFDSKRVPDQNGVLRPIKKQSLLTGDSIVGAQSSFDQYGRPMVSIRLGGASGPIHNFTQATEKNIGKPMATLYVETRYLDQKKPDGTLLRVKKNVEEIINVATINDVLGRQFQITGIRNPKEARDLALLLRAGALPAPVDLVEERTIGPSLGQDNIRMGLNSVLVGFSLVVIFMALYYRLFGIIANLALLMNVLLLVGLLSLLGATLTLPGIAGIVLTLGMAVDANVLIFERIREELRAKVTPQAAIFRGFERAFVTILDANLTTLIVGIVLYAIGTGPVKGFAVTLILGLITSMFTAVTGSRACINWLYGKRQVHRLSIGI